MVDGYNGFMYIGIKFVWCHDAFGGIVIGNIPLDIGHETRKAWCGVCIGAEH